MQMRLSFSDYVLKNIDPALREKLYYCYNNGIDYKEEKKKPLDEELLECLKEWFSENGVIEYI